MNKENKNDSIQIIIYILAMVIILLLFIVAYSLRVSAAPSSESGSHHNSTSSNDAKLFNYVSNSASEYDQLLYGLSNNVFNDVSDSYSDFLYYFVPESALTTSEKEILGYFDDINNGSENPSIIFDIDDSFNWTIKDEYKTDYDSLIDKLCTNINNQYLLYPTKSGDFINKLGYPDFNIQDAKDSLSSYNGDDFPLYCYRSSNRFKSCSLENLNGDSSIDCDGFIFNYGDWSYLCNHWDVFVNHGYLPNVNNQGVNCAFYVYSNSVRYDQRNSFKYNWGSDIFPQPFYVYAYSYYDYWYPNNAQDVTFILGKSDIPMLFFRDFTAYNTFYNNKMSIPYDFSGLDLPDNFDYSQFFKSIDRNLIDTEHSLDVLYSYLNDELSKQLQDILDAQKTTNELLLALLRYYDKNIIKDNINITDILVDIYDTVDVIRDNILFSDDDYNSLSDEVNEAMNNSQIKNKLDNTFPFSVKRDFEHVLDYFDEDIIETNPRFVFNFDLFHDEVHDYVEFDVDLTQLPGINIFRSFFHAFIVVLFNFACFKLYDKFLTWYLS